MNAGTGKRRQVRALERIARCLVLGLVALAAWPLVIPAAQAAPALASAPDRPPQAVSYARIAVVRVLTYYTGSGRDGVPVPVLNPCAADGVLVGTTGSGLNSYTYVLTPTDAVNPITPCQGVQAAFQQLNGRASNWSITRIQVLLGAAYTGTAGKQRGSVTYSIDPALITTNGGPVGPRLLALPLSAGSPAHDLPLLALPQASDAPPATDAGTVIDLVGHDGQLLNGDAVAQSEITNTLYPITVPESAFPGAPSNATPQATSSAGTPTGASTQPAATVISSATSLGVNIGAPVINDNGRLIGMVIPDNQGNHIVASLAEVKKAIGPVNGKPGALMSGWQAGIAAFYANPPKYAEAQTAFSGLLAKYPDFGGVAAYENAAAQHHTAIPSLVEKPSGSSGSGQTSPGVTAVLSSRQLLLIAGGVALALLLAAIVSFVLLRRNAMAQHAQQLRSQRPQEEALLDLLPPDSPLAKPLPDIPLAELEQFAEPQRAPSIEQLDTIQVPAVAAPPRARPMTQPRSGTNLMSYAAGLIDAGVKRANEPNQDNVLALHGVRMAGTRPQPYGLYIVADGMGGHLNGQEASRLTIESVTRIVVQAFNTTQVFDAEMLTHILRDAVQRANAELRQRNMSSNGDMGTTITAALIVEDRAYIVNVGDSRTYHMSPDSGLQRITTDHSVVQSLVSAGVIRPEDVYTHPRRNQIYRSLGGEGEQVEVDTFQVALQAGDKLLLCSDGLWEMVRDPQITLILSSTADPQQAVQLLVREANTNGGEDNIAAIVVRMLDDLPRNAQQGMRVIVAPQGAESPPEGAPLPH
ncbi:MAG TPA: protein phosphatase 2C domain-containing protein [Ktedonobacterales bacterium]|jgi:serine/threonine protein phosphatase PrpC|nr:protein phosphatase 2C domain-containing protein [Ktedonobacterales bacterium]